MTRRWTIAIILLVMAGAAGSARPAYRWWRGRLRKSYGSECRIARESRKWDELKRLAGEWSSRDPANADPWLFLAEAAQADGDLPAVASNLASIPETEPKAVLALIELAKLEFGPLNRPFEAEQACQKLLRLDPRVS